MASASSEAGSSRSQEIEELERFIDSYVLEYQVQGLLTDKTEADGESEKTQSHVSQVGKGAGWKRACRMLVSWVGDARPGEAAFPQLECEAGHKTLNLGQLACLAMYI